VKPSSVTGRIVAGALAGALVGMSAGCGSDAGAYDREAFVQQVMEVNGVDRDTATCIAVGYEEQIGVDRITATSQTPEEIERAANVQAACILGP
jgi:hypothetical protein